MSNLQLFSFIEFASDCISNNVYYICYKLQVLKFIDYIFDT